MFDKDILKWIILIGTAPMWLPFARALWEELNDAMRADGGLTGPEPGPLQREEILRKIAQEEPRMVSETLAHHKDRRGGQRPKSAAHQAGPNAGPQAGNRRNVFGGASRPNTFRR